MVSTERAPAGVAPQRKTAEPTAASRLWSAFAYRDYRFLWSSTIFSFLAMNMQQVARGYLAYDLTGSGTALGLVSVAWGIPQFFVSPIGGVLADRLSKRTIIVLSQSLMAVTTVANAALISAGLIQVWHLVVLGAIQGAVFAFNMPARQALLPSIVEKEKLANAIALQNASANFVQIAGPAAAGFLIAIPSFGVAGVFYVMSICYVLASLAILQIASHGSSASKVAGSMRDEILDGVRYIRQRVSLQTLVVMSAVVVLLAMPYMILMPLFALRVHHVGSEGLGLLTAMTGVGALTGALVVAWFSSVPNKWPLLTVSGVLLGASLAAFALAPSFPVAIVAIMFVGALSNMVMALNNTLLMVDTDLAMQGRVMSIIMMTWSLNPVAALPLSMAADAFGAPITIALAGSLSGILMGVLGYRIVKNKE